MLTYFKSGRTLKNIFVGTQDKDMVKQKSGVIYWFRCGRLGCDEEYSGESAKTFGESFKEHLKVPSHIYEY